jgi:hypothetical protein
MSAHDYVEYRDTCGKCGQELSGFQTNGYGRTSPVLPSDVGHFYTTCPCGARHDYRVTPTAYTIIRAVGEQRAWQS